MHFKRRRIPTRKGPLPFKYVLLISFILFNLFTLQALWLVDNNIKPTLMDIANTEAKKIASEAINNAISEEIVKPSEMDDLVVFHQKNTGKSLVSFNPKIYSKILATTTERIHKNLEQASHQADVNSENKKNYIPGTVYYIPLGLSTNNSLLANFGPKIPVKMTIVGDVTSKVETKIKESGINNTYLEVFLDVEVNTQIVIPFSSEEAKITSTIKLGDLFVEGDVPEFYGVPPAITPKENKED
ncbi:sporulation protein YunB [Fictibacillus sp. 5RED26]|jgi:sporulation protein YunB|nr:MULTISPECIES: sporulation protein YunB [unclassified Fictibacillus]MBH0159147.1 sporulation protein YunB [Fictibacillus sp. 5RED26]MBH0171914.1 sporulation protein YunB [Fictibacillus sp. 18YEL24]